jgi:hypothetical protein
MKRKREQKKKNVGGCFAEEVKNKLQKTNPDV